MSSRHTWNTWQSQLLEFNSRFAPQILLFYSPHWPSISLNVKYNSMNYWPFFTFYLFRKSRLSKAGGLRHIPRPFSGELWGDPRASRWGDGASCYRSGRPWRASPQLAVGLCLTVSPHNFKHWRILRTTFS
jgi:hypothetical protein